MGVALPELEKKIYIWGTGNTARWLFPGMFHHLRKYGYIILGFIDNVEAHQKDGFEGFSVYGPDVLHRERFGRIVLCTGGRHTEEIRGQLLDRMHIPKEKVCFYTDLVREVMLEEYRDSTDREIRDTLAYWKAGNPLDMYNQFLPIDRGKYMEVRWDRTVELPYIMFPVIGGKEKRMYYPRDYEFEQKDNTPVVIDLLREQREASPHLYTKSGHDVQDGDVVADCGVCEGNFALRYVDIASKIYLFEMDFRWLEPLHYTFGSLKNVQLIEKGVSDSSEGDMVALDDAVQEKLDFLKMDIEGYEEKALLGAQKILRKNAVKCSICSYHTRDAKENIEHIFGTYGYSTSVSKGYMLFLCSGNFYESLDFRRGIVYGDRL